MSTNFTASEDIERESERTIPCLSTFNIGRDIIALYTRERYEKRSNEENWVAWRENFLFYNLWLSRFDGNKFSKYTNTHTQARGERTSKKQQNARASREALHHEIHTIHVTNHYKSISENVQVHHFIVVISLVWRWSGWVGGYKHGKIFMRCFHRTTHRAFFGWGES